MPARVSARASSAATSRKSSAQPSNAPAVSIPEEPPLPSTSPQLRANIVAIFADAQRSIATHRKLVVRLRKIQESCCGLSSKKDKKSKQTGEDGERPAIVDDTDGVAEKEFNIEISRCIIRVLGVKKTEGAGDRIIKFLGTFLKSASDKGKPLMTLYTGSLYTQRWYRFRDILPRRSR
jgi:condensin complex subunit 3